MSIHYTPQEIVPKAFPGISDSEARDLLNSGQIKSYPARTILCHENALEDTFYILLDGTVSVTKTINRNENRLLKTLEAGDFFGEMALIHDAPRAATVTAQTEISVMEINKDAFNRALRNSGSISIAMVREISSRLRENDTLAVEDLRLRASELARAYQKLAEQELARREFLTSIAHELRTPLMAAGGYIQLVQKGMVPTDNLPTAVDAIARNIQQITALVNDILFLQEMDLILPKFQPVDLGQLAREITDQYRDKASLSGVNLTLQAAPQLPAVSGDAKSLERTIAALVDNAVKFSPNGGDVTVRVDKEAADVVLAVEDHGIGIEPQRRAHIFDRFNHLEKDGENLFSGIGVGLAIARQVIEQHHGKMDVSSTEGQGSTFAIRLAAIRVAF
jgi:signal transduction histidine kinase